MRRCKRTGKKSYPSELEAQIALTNILYRIHVVRRKAGDRRNQHVPKRFYQCEFCRQWHLTTQEKRGKSRTT